MVGFRSLAPNTLARLQRGRYYTAGTSYVLMSLQGISESVSCMTKVVYPTFFSVTFEVTQALGDRI